MKSVIFQSSLSQWKFKAKLSYCEIWQNLLDHSVAQAYLLPANYLQKEEKNYLQRQMSGIVSFIGFLYPNDQNFDGRNYYVLIERIPNRLSSIKSLTQVQSLKVLYHVYRTLEQVKKEWGPFWLKESSICFNSDGDIKIWKNRDLWNNYTEKTVLEKQNYEEKTGELIRRIFRMVQQRCFNQKLLQYFHFLQSETITFKKAYSTTAKLAQKLFLDIGIKNSQTAIKNDNLCFQMPKLQFKFQQGQSEDEKSSSKNVETNYGKEKMKDLSIKTQRKTVCCCHCPDDFKSYTSRSKGQFEEQAKLQDESWEDFFEIHPMKYESSPSSPRNDFTKRKEEKEKQAQNSLSFNCKKNFQTFGILEEENEYEEQKKKSMFDVDEMEKELKKFTEKKNEIKQKRSSLDVKTDQINSGQLTGAYLTENNEGWSNFDRRQSKKQTGKFNMYGYKTVNPSSFSKKHFRNISDFTHKFTFKPTQNKEKREEKKYWN